MLSWAMLPRACRSSRACRAVGQTFSAARTTLAQRGSRNRACLAMPSSFRRVGCPAMPKNWLAQKRTVVARPTLFRACRLKECRNNRKSEGLRGLYSSCRSPYQTQDEEKHDSSDEGDEDRPAHATERRRDTEGPEQPASDEGTNDSDDYVTNDAVSATHHE